MARYAQQDLCLLWRWLVLFELAPRIPVSTASKMRGESPPEFLKIFDHFSPSFTLKYTDLPALENPFLVTFFSRSPFSTILLSAWCAVLCASSRISEFLYPHARSASNDLNHRPLGSFEKRSSLFLLYLISFSLLRMVLHRKTPRFSPRNVRYRNLGKHAGG